jgi:hypothetical protein
MPSTVELLVIRIKVSANYILNAKHYMGEVEIDLSRWDRIKCWWRMSHYYRKYGLARSYVYSERDIRTICYRPRDRNNQKEIGYLIYDNLCKQIYSISKMSNAEFETRFQVKHDMPVVQYENKLLAFDFNCHVFGYKKRARLYTDVCKRIIDYHSEQNRVAGLN